MPKTTLAGHPLHPILIIFPGGLLPFSLVCDLIYLGTGKKAFAHSAYQSLVGAAVGGVIAGSAGAGDYFEIPTRTSTRKLGRIHGLLNLGLLTMMGSNLFLRKRRPDGIPSGAAPTALNGVSVLGLLLSAWYGAHLIYEHGVRVKGVDPLVNAPEARIPLGKSKDKKVEETLNELADTSLGLNPQTQRKAA